MFVSATFEWKWPANDGESDEVVKWKTGNKDEFHCPSEWTIARQLIIGFRDNPLRTEWHVPAIRDDDKSVDSEFVPEQVIKAGSNGRKRQRKGQLLDHNQANSSTQDQFWNASHSGLIVFESIAHVFDAENNLKATPNG